MCLKQKTFPNKRSKAILLLADVLFCVQQHVENASPKKAFCATSSFSLLLKARSYFLRSHKKIFAFFLCGLQKWFLQLARKDICDFQFCEDSKSKQTIKEETTMWTIYLRFQQKILWKKQWCILQKRFCATAHKSFGVFAWCDVCRKHILFAANAHNDLCKIN